MRKKIENTSYISPIHTFVNIPALIRKDSVVLSSRAESVNRGYTQAKIKATWWSYPGFQGFCL